MSFSKKILALALGGIIAQSAVAQNQVRFTINGEIVTRTCSITSGADKTVTMVRKATSDFNAASQNVSGNVDEKLTLSCPNTSTVKMRMVDNATDASTTASPYLRNTHTPTAERANNAHTSIWFVGTNVTGRFLSTQTDYPLQNKVSDTTASATNTLEYTIRPHYHSTNASVGAGKVQARMTLNFTYE